MKVLFFDLERGKQTLGNDKDIEKLFGYPPLEPTTYQAFTSIIGDIFTIKKVITEKKIGTLKVNEEQLHTVLKNGIDVNAIVLDTFSELSKKYQRSLCDDEGKLKLQDWGRLKNKLDATLEFITRIPGILVVNAHTKTATMDNGISRLLPYIDGSTKEDISKWFDFVLYCKTIPGPQGNEEYVWHTRHSERYTHGKDRTGLLDKEIPQDFQIVLEAAKEKGFENVKILVLGEPGTGKTLSLKTLIKEKANGN